MPAASLVNLIPHLIALARNNQALNCPGVLSRHLLLKTKGLLLLFFLFFVADLGLGDLAKVTAGAREGYRFLLITFVGVIRGDIRNYALVRGVKDIVEGGSES